MGAARDAASNVVEGRGVPEQPVAQLLKPTQKSACQQVLARVDKERALARIRVKRLLAKALVAIVAIGAQVQGSGAQTVGPRTSVQAAAQPVSFSALSRAQETAPKGPLGGYNVLIADRGNNRLLLVNEARKILWQYDFPGLPPENGADDAFFADGGKSIVTNLEHEQVIQVIDVATKTVTWQYGTLGKKGSTPGLLDFPDDAYKLPNGNIIVADIRNCRILEIAPDKRIARQAGQTGRCWGPDRLNSPNGDKPLPNGNVLISTIGDHAITELDKNWKEVARLVLPISYPSDPQLTRDGNFLVAGYTRPGKVMEIAKDGRIVWQYRPQAGGALNKPSLAIELPNGNILVNDDLNARVVVIDKASNRIVWQYGETGQPGAAPGHLRIPDGLDIIKAD